MSAIGDPSRQQRVLDALEAWPAPRWLDGIVVIGSLAGPDADAASDVDLVVVVAEGRFADASSERTSLHRTGALVAWDHRPDPAREVAAHKWFTTDLVLVEALVATPSSGVRLAPPFRVLVGGESAAARLASRPPVERAEMEGTGLHPAEAAYDALKRALREAARDR